MTAHKSNSVGMPWLNQFLSWLIDNGFEAVMNEPDELCRMKRGAHVVCVMARARGQRFTVNEPCMHLLRAFKNEMKAQGRMAAQAPGVDSLAG
jgi:hypothetical protein